ncbi:ABC transporter permease [Brenneria goodwinii]|uniref:ABC transporter permease n=1 Tax=Brenneria goodwinii TaxID=1109412 RepID=A0A0G4JZV4_9GAMM|nr:ABC transporter permease [Brenneria goodwinii]ATA23838.1 ABC transporter permease [Brenneria goodwinii]MCG8155779.1 ABC transporter permease [Brenneria goodwinii]MCG8160611.1 ABC transporter permease [Brenneria goodwinii]MCG8166287.1 ABC transporter permease [Brenneria goodwinii]MCG8171151.1 ABC transporter permease [Brenneria goodwinii]
MLSFFAVRAWQSLLVLLLMSILVFMAVYAIGNPIDILINPQADQALREATIARYGLDKPMWEQYLVFLGNALHGDFGESFIYNVPAMGLILEYLPATLELAVVAMAMTIIIGVPLGMYAGYRPDSWLSKSIMGGSVLAFSVPGFWMGLMLILIFSVELGWFSSGGRGETVTVLGIPWSVLTLDGWAHLLLPAINLALFRLALIVRLTRAGVREAILSDYVKFARAKGVPPMRILLRHVMRNIMIPLTTVLGLEFGAMVAFSVVTETIFSWPGAGKLVIDSIRTLDQPVVVSYLLLVAAMFVVINLLVDMLYSLLDPRIRLGSRK